MWWLVRVVSLTILLIEVGSAVSIFVWWLVLGQLCEPGNADSCGLWPLVAFAAVWFVGQFLLLPFPDGAVAALLTQQSRDRRVYRG